MAEDTNKDNTKKDSFTFSDKIDKDTKITKNAKTAPMPFTKRFSAARIGSDGKPKMTFFERTKRDAPFFIAALIILLLLPFFIKFTGMGADESDILVRNPFDTVSDGGAAYGACLDENGNLIDGCVAGASGRDSIDLLADALKSGATPEATSAVYTPTQPVTAPSAQSAFDYGRTTAPASMGRALGSARKATELGRLSPGQMATAGGHLGGLYGPMAASGYAGGQPGPARPSKPITLTPLSGAGGRSVGGEAALVEARRSANAMGKRDAMQALMDALGRNPAVGPGGGLGAGNFGGGGLGGSGLNNKWSYQGQKPWWWDMMAERAQAKWMFWFHLWSDALKTLVNGFGMKMLCCLLAGQDDCSVDKFWGTGAQDASAGSCGPYLDAPALSTMTGSIDDHKKCCIALCGSRKTGSCDEKDSFMTSCLGEKKDETIGFSKPHPAADATGPWQQRTGCWGYHGAGAGLTLQCQTTPSIATYAQPKGKAEGWNIYQYVIINSREILEDGKPGNFLCGDMSPNRSGAPTQAGLIANEDGQYVNANNAVRAQANAPAQQKKRPNKKASAKYGGSPVIQEYDGGGAGQSGDKSFMGGGDLKATPRGVISLPNSTWEGDNTVNGNDCVAMVIGGNDVGTSPFMSITLHNQSDQGRKFDENMLKQYLTNFILPILYGCNPDVNTTVQASNNKVTDLRYARPKLVPGRNPIETDGTKDSYNYFPAKENSCRNYLSRIYVKAIGALAMQEPLAVNRSDMASRTKAKQRSYIPDLPITVNDFNRVFVLQKGNDFTTNPNQVTTVTNDTRRDNKFHSNLCGVNRTLGPWTQPPQPVQPVQPVVTPSGLSYVIDTVAMKVAADAGVGDPGTGISVTSFVDNWKPALPSGSSSYNTLEAWTVALNTQGLAWKPIDVGRNFHTVSVNGGLIVNTPTAPQCGVNVPPKSIAVCCKDDKGQPVFRVRGLMANAQDNPIDLTDAVDFGFDPKMSDSDKACACGVADIKDIPQCNAKIQPVQPDTKCDYGCGNDSRFQTILDSNITFGDLSNCIPCQEAAKVYLQARDKAAPTAGTTLKLSEYLTGLCQNKVTKTGEKDTLDGRYVCAFAQQAMYRLPKGNFMNNASKGFLRFVDADLFSALGYTPNKELSLAALSQAVRKNPLCKDIKATSTLDAARKCRGAIIDYSGKQFSLKCEQYQGIPVTVENFRKYIQAFCDPKDAAPKSVLKGKTNQFQASDVCYIGPGASDDPVCHA